MDIDGMVPDGVRALQDELRKAESVLDSAENELWNLLRQAASPPLMPTPSAGSPGGPGNGSLTFTDG